MDNILEAMQERIARWMQVKEAEIYTDKKTGQSICLSLTKSLKK